MKDRHLAILIAAVALVGAACSGAATAAPTATPTTTPTAAPTAAPTTATPIPTATAAPIPTPTARPEPTFSPTGKMAVGRGVQTATLLTDGRVLVAGGYTTTGDLPLASAELYHADTGTFSPTGSLAVARGFHTATLLSDGRVLIAAGSDRGGVAGGLLPVASAELYDPKSGKSRPTGSLATARSFHTATLLSDARVLVAGGCEDSRHALASAELYDPKTGKFSATGSMAVARCFHTATLLADGRVLIVGGYSAGWTLEGMSLASAEIYDPTTGTFSPTGSLVSARGNHTATLLADGRVLITGGASGGVGTVRASLDAAELYDPQTGRFTWAGRMANARTFHTATRLADGRVLVAGGDPAGWAYDGPFLTSAEVYDPKTGVFSPTGSMTDRRAYHTATVLADDRVLVAGGDDPPTALDTAEIYGPQSGK